MTFKSFFEKIFGHKKVALGVKTVASTSYRVVGIIDNTGTIKGVVNVSLAISDESMTLECAKFNYHPDSVIYSPDVYGPVPPPCDQNIQSVVELDNYLRTMPPPL
jgi:hypothetical protein